jgi:hypothetical protein
MHAERKIVAQKIAAILTPVQARRPIEKQASPVVAAGVGALLGGGLIGGGLGGLGGLMFALNEHSRAGDEQFDKHRREGIFLRRILQGAAAGALAGGGIGAASAVHSASQGGARDVRPYGMAGGLAGGLTGGVLGYAATSGTEKDRRRQFLQSLLSTLGGAGTGYSVGRGIAALSTAGAGFNRPSQANIMEAATGLPML